MSTLDVTILMPCLNEAETLAICVRNARAAIDALGRPGEVLIADNGSTDGSQAIAEAEGARVLPVPTRGYGAALIAGIQHAEGKYILMGDADDSYDFGHLPRFIAELETGKDLVMGNRFDGGIIGNAMPPLHRYLGNPVLSFIGRLFFKVPIGDFHCGMRAFRTDSMRQLNLRTTGMEFASEMVVKSALQKLSIGEVPTTLKPDGRTRAPHLRTWRDGWRHLRFLLMYSPRWLFFYPGLVLTLIGFAVSAWLVGGERHIGNLSFDVDTLAYSIGMMLIGTQAVIFAMSAKLFGTREGFLPVNVTFERGLEKISLESGLIAGLLLVLAGLGVAIYAVVQWHTAGFGRVTPEYMLRLTLPSAAMMMLGVEAIFASFFLGLLQIRHR
ncbi:MAG: glycosyltransferase family 2 protein [Bryocella sp.]